MPPQNLPHANAISSATMTLTAAFSATHIVRCQLPVTLADDCEPEPDVALVTREHMREGNAQGKHPTRPDLILEVADRSLSYASTWFAPEQRVSVADLLGPPI